MTAPLLFVKPGPPDFQDVLDLLEAGEIQPVEMEFVGADGNGMAILGRFRAHARRCSDWMPDMIEAVLTEARSGNYDHLLSVIESVIYDINYDQEDEW